MILLAFLVTLTIIALRVWTRVETLTTTIADLTLRIDALERSRPLATTPPAPPAVVPTAPPPPVLREAAVTAPPLPPKVAVRPEPVPPLPQPVPKSAPPPTREALETRIGSRWLLYVGVVAIVVGVAYFEKLAIDNHWVTETTRILQGAIVGLLLVVGGLQFVHRGYRLYGQLLTGSGVAIWYVSTFAAYNFYHLIRQPLAFALMTAVTAVAAGLADRQRSQGLALVAVGGGFATPFLLPTGTDAEVALFGYDLFLVAGTMALARRRDWPTLNVVSYGFTVLTFLGWANQFYVPAKYLTTEWFLTAFCAMFLYVLRAIRHSRHPSARVERAILWTAPVGYYGVSLAILGAHSAALLIYLVLLSLVGVLVARQAGAWARLMFWGAVSAPLLIWSGLHGIGLWFGPGLAIWAAVYLLNLVALLEATVWNGRTLRAGDVLLLHLNGLVTYAGAYLLLDPAHGGVSAPLAAALAIVNGVLGAALARQHRDEALHFAAIGFTLSMIAAGLHFEGPWITVAWAAEGAVIVWLGLRERREWLSVGGLLLFSVAIGRTLTLQFAEAPVGQLVLANPRALSGVFVIALTYAITWAYLRYRDGAGRSVGVGAGLLVAKLLLLALAASEILAYWSLHAAPPFEPVAQVIDAALVAGAVIVWLGLRRQQTWIRGVGAVILSEAGLSLFAIQLQPAPLAYVSMLNARAGAGVLAIVVLLALALECRRSHVTAFAVHRAVLITSAGLLALSLMTSEIDAFWAARGAADTWSMAREALHAIAWSGIAGVLVWHGLVTRRGWVRAIGGVLLIVGVLRLLRLQLAASGPTYLVIANARVVASMAVIAVVYGLAHLYRSADVGERPYRPSAVLMLVANALTLTLLTSEITAFWHVHDVHALSSDASVTSHLAREAMVSVTWGLYATLLIVVGLWKRYAPIRYFAMTVFLITIVKVFAVDLAELDRIYRVLSVIGVGLTLLLTSYLYQRLRSAVSE
jgi:hypothetical protein